jgi:hypothetical protein
MKAALQRAQGRQLSWRAHSSHCARLVHALSTPRLTQFTHSPRHSVPTAHTVHALSTPCVSTAHTEVHRSPRHYHRVRSSHRAVCTVLVRATGGVHHCSHLRHSSVSCPHGSHSAGTPSFSSVHPSHYRWRYLCGHTSRLTQRRHSPRHVTRDSPYF